MGCFGSFRSRRAIPINNKAKPSARFQKPLKNMKFLSLFGKRGRTFHTGIDIRGRRKGGDSVLASRSGRVIWAGKKRGYGKLISLKHADGFMSRYAHLKKIFVKKGDKIKALERIGTVGSSGRADGPHLHFEILTPKGYFMDPKPLIRNGR